jgi:hypothetical protein
MIRKLLRPTPAERPDTDEILAIPQIRAKVGPFGRLEYVLYHRRLSHSRATGAFVIQTGEDKVSGTAMGRYRTPFDTISVECSLGGYTISEGR